MDDSLVAYKKIGIDYERDLYFGRFMMKGRLKSLEKVYDKVKKKREKALSKKAIFGMKKIGLFKKKKFLKRVVCVMKIPMKNLSRVNLSMIKKNF